MGHVPTDEENGGYEGEESRMRQRKVINPNRSTAYMRQNGSQIQTNTRPMFPNIPQRVLRNNYQTQPNDQIPYSNRSQSTQRFYPNYNALRRPYQQIPPRQYINQYPTYGIPPNQNKFNNGMNVASVRLACEICLPHRLHSESRASILRRFT